MMPATLRERGLLLTAGVMSLFDQMFLTHTFSRESITIVTVARYIGIALNAGWDWLFWNGVPDTLTIAGDVLIVMVCIALSWARKG